MSTTLAPTSTAHKLSLEGKTRQLVPSLPKGAAPPQDLKAEKALLGALIIAPENFPTVAAFLNASDFYIHRHAWIYEAFQRLVKRHELVDFLTLVNELDAGGKFADVDRDAYLTQLMEGVPTSTHAEAYARAVQRASSKRKAIALAGFIVRAAFSPNGSLEGALGQARDRLDVLVTATGAREREVWTPADLCGQELPDTPWLLDGFLVDGGVGLLVGPAGAGKTYLALDLPLAVHSGRSAWGHKAQQGAVVYAGSDSPRRTLRRRLADLCQGREIPPPDEGFLLDLSPLDLGQPQGAVILRRLVDRVQAKLVVLDALYCFMPGLDENAAGDVGLVMGHIREVARETGASVLLIHHANKNDLASLTNRVRGSSALTAAIDTGLMVAIAGSGDSMVRTFTCFKNRELPEAASASFVIEDGEAGGLVLAFTQRAGSLISDTLVEAAVGMLLGPLREADGALTRKALEEAARSHGFVGSSRTTDRAFQVLRQMPEVHIAKMGTANWYSWARS